ncbi:MAG: alcohol dehydrogenase catalytic domain-containing protein, partial [Candidatus Aminicenantes bacterium]|nr:alcohol dehydrogenase catalytic domain-containing protein [Candidatus Aminicenantes bacterium]
PKPGWARIRVKTSGICKTDLEIMKGYMGFSGILGHEFVGKVEHCAEQSWVGKRVVGEINAACGHCSFCEAGLGRHCPNRTTLGILNHDGCFAEFCLLPTANLHVVPPEIPDDRAVLTEPLSAACEILEQRPVGKNERVVVLGDGRIGILCAWVLSTASTDVTIVGRHPAKLQAARWKRIKTASRADEVTPGADLIVEATGSGSGIVEAMSICRPRGTIVLKSTVALQGEVNLAPLVINEQTLLGSRCGRFVDGLKMMKQFPDMPLDRLITDRFPLHRADEAFERAGNSDALKILLDV